MDALDILSSDGRFVGRCPVNERARYSALVLVGRVHCVWMKCGCIIELYSPVWRARVGVLGDVLQMLQPPQKRWSNTEYVLLSTAMSALLS